MIRLLFVLLLFGIGRAEELALTAEDAVRLALERNSSLAVSNFQPALQEADVTAARGVFDPRLTTGVGGRSQGVAYSARLEHRVAYGATYGIEYSTGTDLAGRIGSQTSLTLRVPLLRGAGADVNRAGVNTALGEVDLARLELQADRLDLMAEAETAYWSLVMARSVLRVRERAVEQGGQFIEILKTEIEVGVSAPYEIYEAEQNLASRVSDVEEARGNVELAEQRLLRLLGLVPGEWRVVPMEPGLKAGSEKERKLGRSSERDGALEQDQESQSHSHSGQTLLSLKEYQERSLRSRPILKVGEKLKELGELRRKVAANRTLPQLDLVAGHALGATGLSQNSWRAGVQLTVPVGNHQGRGALRRAELEVEQAEAQLEDIRQRVLLETAQALTSVKAADAQIEAAELASESAAKRVESELERFKAGFTAAHRVIFAQQQQLNTDEQAVAAQIRRNLALVALKRATGEGLKP